MKALLARFDLFATRRFGRVDDPANERRAFALFLLAHLVVWTLYAALSQNNVSSYVDMFENWAWGREFQLGYYKHPPLFAWVAGVWFHVFPRADWAYFLLSAVVTATGFSGVFAAIGTVERGPRRLLGVAALALSPIYGFLAIKFNANAILLAVWPWAIWAFLRAVKTPTIVNGILVGVTLALAMLGKYVSLTLILAMLAALVVPAERRPLLRSPTMLAAVIAGLVVLGPHLGWLAAHDFATVRYADDQTAKSTVQFFVYLVRFPLAQALYLLPVLLAVALCVPRASWRAWRGALAWRSASPDRRTVLCLAFGPFVATVALGIATWSQLSSPWGFPLWCLIGWVIVATPGLDAAGLRPSRLFAVLAIWWALLLIVVAPIVDVVSVRARAIVGVAPGAELAKEATRVWHEVSGGRRLSVVAGSGWANGAVVFYSLDGPSEWIDFDLRVSSWVTPERIAREGVLAVCPLAEESCAAEARTNLGPDVVERDITVSKRWWGRDLPAASYRLFLRLPQAGA